MSFERRERAQRTNGGRRPTESLAGEPKGRRQAGGQPAGGAGGKEEEAVVWFANLHHATSGRP